MLTLLTSAWASIKEKLEYLGAPTIKGVSSAYSTSSVSSIDVPLPPDINQGDYVIYIAAGATGTGLPANPFFTDQLSYIAFWNSENTIFSTNTLGSLIAKAGVATGNEQGTMSFTVASPTYVSVFIIVIEKNTYTLPRGVNAGFSSYTGYGSGSIGHSRSNYSNSAVKHSSHFYPYWGQDDGLVLSILGKTDTLNDPVSFPLPDNQNFINIEFSQIPDVRFCTDIIDSNTTLPFSLPDYSKTQYTPAGTSLIVIKGKSPIKRPYCIEFFGASSAATKVNTALAHSSDASLKREELGDLQIVIIMMYSGASVIITPPTGFTLVGRYGSKLAVYKRVLTKVVSNPYTFIFSTGISVMSKLLVMPLGSYDENAEIIAAFQASTISVNSVCPAIIAPATWSGLTNYTIRTVVREGSGGDHNRNVSDNGWPSNSPELRCCLFNYGAENDGVSYASAGGVVQGNSVPSATFNFKWSLVSESVTLFVKGKSFV